MNKESLYVMLRILFTSPLSLLVWVVVTMGCSPAFAGIGLPETHIITYEEDYFSREQPTPFQVRVTDPTGVKAVRCYFRFTEDMPFVFVDLDSVGEDQYSASIPQLSENAEKIEFFFLVVNGYRQVIKTTPHYRLPGVSRQDILGSVATADIQTELDVLPININHFFSTELPAIKRVALQKAYGYLDGVYTPEEVTGLQTTPGYYGGFLLDDNGEFQLTPGLLIRAPTSKDVAKAAPKEGSEVLGPDIRGEDWTGEFFLYPHITMFEEITAVITQNALGFVTITTTKEAEIGRYFEGEIQEDGDMYLIDQYDDEDWTTFYGPASASEILIADWVDKSYQERYQIHLKREVPPDPEPEPITLFFLENLLLNK